MLLILCLEALFFVPLIVAWLFCGAAGHLIGLCLFATLSWSAMAWLVAREHAPIALEAAMAALVLFGVVLETADKFENFFLDPIGAGVRTAAGWFTSAPLTTRPGTRLARLPALG